MIAISILFYTHRNHHLISIMFQLYLVRAYFLLSYIHHNMKTIRIFISYDQSTINICDSCSVLLL